MAKLICPLPGVPCFDPAEPISNFSTETEDSANFLSSFRGGAGAGWGFPFGWPGAQPFSPFPTGTLGGTPGTQGTPGTPGVELPPLGQYWIAEACGFYCVSDISQDDADICAYNLSQQCLPDIWSPPIGPFPGTPNPNPVTLFGNEPQSCTATCPDGSLFTYTVIAGFFTATSQAQANNIAYSYACSKARQNLMCMGNLTASMMCLGELFSASISSVVRNPPATFDIVAGALPPGLTEQTSTSGTVYLISGVPSASGAYPFTLRATDASGNTSSRTYTLNVIGITNASLPDGAPAGSYSATLVAEGPTTGDITWSLFSGTLPDGLTLDPDTGEISGTIDSGAAAQDYPITVKMCDENAEGICCQKQLTITVEASCPIILPWTEIFSVATGTCSGTDSYVLCEMNGTVNGGTGTGLYANWQTVDFTNTSGVPVTIRFGGTHDSTAVASPGPDTTQTYVRADVYWTVISGAGSSGGPANMFTVSAVNNGGPVDTDHQTGPVSFVDVVVPAGSHFLFELDIDAEIDGINFGTPDGTVSSVFNLTVSQI